MTTRIARGAAALGFGLLLGLTGCNNDGPAERAGEGIDNAARDVKDAVTPAGPMEKAGRDVDRALNK